MAGQDGQEDDGPVEDLLAALFAHATAQLESAHTLCAAGQAGGLEHTQTMAHIQDLQQLVSDIAAILAAIEVMARTDDADETV